MLDVPGVFDLSHTAGGDTTTIQESWREGCPP